MRFRTLLLTMWLAGGCVTGTAALQAPRASRVPPPPPVLLVHGFHDSPSRMEPLKHHLEQAGWPVVRAMALEPNDGRVGVPELALQVSRAAEALREETGAARIDIVGFSMGALVSRFWVQWLGGREVVRRFVSISGPQAGTVMAYLLPGEGVKQMRPHSRLLRALNRDPHPWGPVEVFTFWTPLDIIVVPANSAQLPDATDRTFPVLLHHWMVEDARVLDSIVEVLGAPDPSR
ncbi:lipase family alpha/beta hydrolase [Hyalangium versicolor]|uniref:lipase family alpha/beta hydrolase n=1 Tax=Hyalangium versicolor TaxID=2861190 RepID=UPI001CCEEAAC|nr:lipase [Hyalangium versicolor]